MHAKNIWKEDFRLLWPASKAVYELGYSVICVAFKQVWVTPAQALAMFKHLGNCYSFQTLLKVFPVSLSIASTACANALHR
jgi:hypothetical protein